MSQSIRAIFTLASIAVVALLSTKSPAFGQEPNPNQSSENGGSFRLVPSDYDIFNPSENPVVHLLPNDQRIPNVKWDEKTVEFTVPMSQDMHIVVNFKGEKAQAVFLRMKGRNKIIMFYKGQTPNESSLTGHLFVEAHQGQKVTWEMTTASKDRSSNEGTQPWWNAHPLEKSPLSKGGQSAWQTDDSRDNPPSEPNISINLYHKGTDFLDFIAR